MPLEFDPGWEYWTADPEIEEITSPKNKVRAMDYLSDVRQSTQGYSVADLKYVVKTKAAPTAKIDSVATAPYTEGRCKNCLDEIKELIYRGKEKKFCSPRCRKNFFSRKWRRERGKYDDTPVLEQV